MDLVVDVQLINAGLVVKRWVDNVLPGYLLGDTNWFWEYLKKNKDGKTWLKVCENRRKRALYVIRMLVT